MRNNKIDSWIGKQMCLGDEHCRLKPEDEDKKWSEGRGDEILDRVTREGFTEVILSKDSNANFHGIMKHS